MDRLEQRGLVTRQVNATDRRFIRIYVTEVVERYLKHTLPSHRLSLLTQALQSAYPDERKRILDSITLLRHLIEAKFVK